MELGWKSVRWATLCSSVLLTAVLWWSPDAQAQALRVVTEDWAPFNYLEKGQPTGLATEMVQALLNDAGSNASVEFLPWNRAYADSLREPNVLIFTMGRNAEREELFEWVFKVTNREIWLYRLANRDELALKSLAEAHGYRIGTGPTEDASTRDLVHAGFILGKNLDPIQAADPDAANLQKLMRKRVDFIAVNPVGIAFAARKAGVDMKLLVAAVPVSQDGLGYWVALNRNSSAVTIQKVTASARKLEKQGVFKAILEKYSR
jgi:polar amino acid transport system substrate-binding protein